MKTLKDILSMALKTEEEGARFYRETAQIAVNPLVAATFEYLADEEDNHVKIFKEYLQNEHLADQNMIEHHHISAKDGIKKIFNRSLKQKIKKLAKQHSDKTDIYDIALKIEQKSYDLYKFNADLVDGEKEKKFLQFLYKQESTHFKILQESKEFLDNPGDWFSKEERWMQI